jgi:hypothetical protein
MIKKLKDWSWWEETSEELTRGGLESRGQVLIAEARDMRNAAVLMSDGNGEREELVARAKVTQEQGMALLKEAQVAPTTPQPRCRLLVHGPNESGQLVGDWLSREQKITALELSKTTPVAVGQLDTEANVWLHDGVAYLAESDLTADDVFALITEAANRRRLKLQKAHALVAMNQGLDERAKRQPIPNEITMLVWQRDHGRCVECGSNEELEYDHIIPLAMGGSNTERNLQLLCAPCNRRKGATLG